MSMQVPKKVLCVYECKVGEEYIPKPEIGNTYTPDYMVKKGTKYYYVLKEFGYPYAYWIKAFVELDEDEIVIENKNEKCYAL